MKWLIASDIHGSAHWCQKLLKAFDAEGADRLLLLGDLLYHGPRNPLPDDYDPKRVAALLNQRANRIMCVRGNCDSEVDQMMLEFPIMADYALLESGSQLLFATHGHVFNADNLPPLQPGDIVAQGHTHVPTCQQLQGVWHINPGSTTLPKQGSWHGYLVFENATFTWKSLDGEAVSLKPLALH